jgi:hypothetical protein
MSEKPSRRVTLLRRVGPRCVVCGHSIEVGAVELKTGPQLPKEHGKQPPYFADGEHLDEALRGGWLRFDDAVTGEHWRRG